jgi:hypothetical protein
MQLLQVAQIIQLQLAVEVQQVLLPQEVVHVQVQELIQ